MIARFVIVGTPVPQGSKTAMLLGKWTTIGGVRALLNPRAVIVEGRNMKRADGTRSDGRERHKAWRAAVKRVAQSWARRHDLEGPFSGPLSVAVTFYLPRPASLPKRVLYPAKKPDLSKLVRAIEDSLTDAELIADDGLIVTTTSHKRFALDGRPRAEIAIEELNAFATVAATVRVGAAS